MGTALAIYEKVDNPIAFCDAMSETCAAITGCNLSQGKGVALTCLCEGLTPVEFKRRYHWIPSIGPTMRADAMRAEFRMNYGGDFEILEATPDVARIKFIDGKGRELISEVTWQQAVGEFWPWKKDRGPGTQKNQPTIDNLKDNWATPLNRAAMLVARATSTGLRLICPELVAGIYTPEEMQDLDVVSTAVTTTGEKRRTAAEVMAEAAAPTTTLAAPPAEDVADAEFTVAEPPFETPPQPMGDGFATAAQVERLNELREALNPPQNVWDEAIKKRGATTAHGLKQADAQDLIDKFEAKRRRAPEKN